MKIALKRSSPTFWLFYFMIHFSFLLVVLFFVRILWFRIIHETYRLDFGEIAFESVFYAFFITLIKWIRYVIGKKRYEKNPVDRRKNNLFRE